MAAQSTLCTCPVAALQMHTPHAGCVEGCQLPSYLPTVLAGRSPND
jgi:hypothetical protein